MRADDALKYAAALLHARTDWALDSIAGSGCSGEHDDELNALSDITAEVNGLASDFGDRFVYSDGRAVKTCKQIDAGLVTEHIWHPDQTQEQPASWRGSLPSGDPDVPSPGMYEVSTDPATQEIHVRVVRAA
jgi:hypothetical protein